MIRLRIAAPFLTRGASLEVALPITRLRTAVSTFGFGPRKRFIIRFTRLTGFASLRESPSLVKSLLNTDNTTVSMTVSKMPVLLSVAVRTVTPEDMAVTSPVLEIVATLGFDEDHVTVDVKSAVESSV